MFDLRDYQERAVNDALRALDCRPIIVAPTGAGKTVIATELIRRISGRTLWLAHRRELIAQALARLRAHGLHCGAILAGVEPDRDAPVQVASVQTLARRNPPPADLVVVDEAHHASADSYLDILDAYPGVAVVGLTATPFRLDGRGLGDLFGSLVIAASTAELCDRGILHAPKVYTSKAPDLRGVRVRAGDYETGALATAVNRSGLTADIVSTWQRHAAGRRTVAFAVNVEHSRAIVAAFHAAGVQAEHLDGATPHAVRDATLARLASGETLIVANCVVLSEGWDLPALECAIIARPTASLNLHLQMIGRIMRAAEGKDGAIVLDHAGNHHVHGLVTRELDYTLSPGERVGSTERLGLRRCAECGLLYEPRLPACPECGAVPQPARETPDVSAPGELVEFVSPPDFDYHVQVWNQLEAQRIAARYREGWSYFRFVETVGVHPVLADIDGRTELVDRSRATTREKRGVYARLVATARTKGYALGWAAHQYRRVFGVWPRGFVTEVRGE